MTTIDELFDASAGHLLPTADESRREIGKWLNERPNRGLDRRAVAVLCADADRDAARLEWLLHTLPGVALRDIGVSVTGGLQFGRIAIDAAMAPPERFPWAEPEDAAPPQPVQPALGAPENYER